MPAIRTDGLTKYYGDVRGVEELSFAVEEGEVFGFLGPNGAGKTTTIRTLMGFQSPTSGGATVLGADVTDAETLRQARARIGYLPSEPGFDEHVTGRRLLEYHGALRGDTRSEELLELFHPPLSRKVGEYSRGNRQMLAIVLAFMHDPDLLIMDEPTAGLDPLKQEAFLSFVREERERGTTFFFSSHVLSEVRKVCDRVGIIRDGRLAELATVDSLLDRSGKRVRATVAGAVDDDAFDLPEVHDLTVGGHGAGGRGTGGRGVDGDGTSTLSFTYTGAYEPLLERLLGYDLRDLSIEEAPLEDVFMRFYDTDGRDSAASRTASDDAPPSETTDHDAREDGDA